MQFNSLTTIIAKAKSPGRFTQNVANTVAVQVLSLVLSMGNAAIIARLLGADGKGVVQLALMIPAMLSLFLNGGIGVANAHFIGKKRFDVASLTSNAVTFAILATMIGAIIVALLVMTDALSSLIPGIPLGLFLLALSSLPLALLSGYFSTILQGLQNIRAINIIKLIVALLNLLFLGLFLYYLQFGISGAVYASLLSSLVNIIVLAWYLRQHGAHFIPRWNREVLQTTLQFGLRGYIGNVLQFFNYRLDVFIVNFFLGPSGVGIYSVSTKLAELVWYFPNAVSFVIFPKAAAASANEMNNFTPRVFRVTLFISVLASIMIALIGRPLIRFIYSSEFSQAFLPLLVLLPGVILLGAARVLTNDIAGRGFPQYNSINSAMALIVTIGLDISLIPKFGILGASIASSIAYTLTFVMSLYFYRRVSLFSTLETVNAQ